MAPPTNLLSLLAEGWSPQAAREALSVTENGGCTHAEPASDAPVVGADELAELDDLDGDLS